MANFFEKSDISRNQAENIVSDTLSKCDDGELYLENSKSESILLDDNKIKNSSYSSDLGFGFRAISGEVVAYSHSNEISKNKIELENSTDPGLFKNDFEKKLYKKIQEIRKYFTSLGSREDCKKTLEILADAKTDVSNFFDNVIVNDEDEAVKKNRLELMQLLCKTFNNYLNFSNIESA